MKHTLIWVLAAAVIGAVGGAALGYWEARLPADAALAELGSSKAEPAADGPQPQAVVEETTYNFDKMETGAKEKHTFPIRNQGQAPLEVTFVAHTCKCTTVELNGQAVEPGDAVTIPPKGEAQALLEWVGAAAGPFRHGASFTTNDPANSRLELQVEGEIVESTTLLPSQLIFGSVRAGEPAAAEVFVVASTEPEVEVLSYEAVDAKLAERMKIAIEPVAKGQLPTPDAEAAVRIVATFEPGGTLGPFAGALNLTTNLKRAPSLTIPIFGMVKGDISIFGDLWNDASGLLRMAPATSAAGGKARLAVSIRGKHAGDTELTVGRVDPPELRATLGERQAIRDNFVRVPLTVEIPPGTRPMVRAGDDQGGEGEIILQTTHPMTPEVRLRVMFTVK